MGGFFLAEQTAPVNWRAVRRVMAARGLDHPREIAFTRSKLLVWGKRLGDGPLVFRSPSGLRAVATGTLIYRGKVPEESLPLLVRDHEAGTVDHGALRGAFCVLFDDGRRVAVLSDEAGLYHLFSDRSRRILTSSFLAAAAVDGERRIDRAALLDNLCCGFVPAPHTLLFGVQRIEGADAGAHSLFAVLARPVRERPARPPRSGRAAVAEQLSRLQLYFTEIGPLARRAGVDIGISGGWDSRLLLLLATRLGAPLSTHTHLKEIPDGDIEVAREVAGALGVPLHELPGRHPHQLTAPELADLVGRALLFFDGRVTSQMDLLRSYYTPEYRERALGAARLTLTGVGGEIYRNHDRSAPYPGSLRAWIGYHVVGYPALWALASDDDRDALLDHLAAVITAALGRSRTAGYDLQLARRFYSDVWLPNWHGVRNSAENTLASFLAPFADREITLHAQRATALLGAGDDFEAAMIAQLDSRLASIPTSYGFAPDAIPRRARLAATARAWLPSRLKLLAGRAALAAHRPAPLPALESLTTRHPLLATSYERLRSLDLPIVWERYMTNHGRITLALSLGCVLGLLEEGLGGAALEQEAS